MKVRYRSYEEMVFNIETHHNYVITPDEHKFLKTVAGTEVEVRLSQDKPPDNCCDLPIFEEVNPRDGYGIHLCGHFAHID